MPVWIFESGLLSFGTWVLAVKAVHSHKAFVKHVCIGRSNSAKNITIKLKRYTNNRSFSLATDSP